MKNILNIAAGKQKPLELHKFFPNEAKTILNIDTSYFTNNMNAEELESFLNKRQTGYLTSTEVYFNYDIFEYMERTTMIFDHVVLYRFLEHVSFTQVNYFIYLVSTIIKKGGVVDIIVPDYSILANMILKEHPFSSRENFEASNILLTTELLNEPSCPHASIWTDLRAKYFWELEGRFEIKAEDIYRRFEFDGRNIYLRFLARRK